MAAVNRNYTYAMLAVLLWSTVASAFKLSLKYLNFVQLLFYASAVSTLALLVIVSLSGKWTTFKNHLSKNWEKSLALGLLNPLLYYAVLFKAYSLLPGQEAQALNYTWAIALSLLSVPLLKHKLTAKSLLAILVSFSGALIVATRGNLAELRFADPLGDTLALFSAVIWAIYWIFNTKEKQDDAVKLASNFLMGLPLVAAFALASSELTVPVEGLFGAAYVGVFEMGVTFVLWSKALSSSESAAKVCNLIYLSPFLSLVFLHAVVGEAILPSTVIGLVLIVAGIAVQSRVI